MDRELKWEIKMNNRWWGRAILIEEELFHKPEVIDSAVKLLMDDYKKYCLDNDITNIQSFRIVER